LRPVIDIYISLTGLGQRWSMFWSPPTVDQYLRVRYYIGSDGSRGSTDGPVWMATELVLPAHREDQIRTFQSFRDSYRDKAMAIALDDFYQHRPRELVRPDTTSGELPDDLAPIARYFARQFERNHLQPPERIVRTEVWYGSVSNPDRGSSLDSRVYEERRETVRSYHEAPVENHLNVPPYPPYHAGEQESDISWLLEYFE
jgi:hypothetical protein